VLHPQTDGLSEQTNQWVEQYLCLIAANQNEWSKWLPMVTVVHNNCYRPWGSIRANAHVSCATGQESILHLCTSLDIHLFDPSPTLFHVHHSIIHY
jgi:hypothetical protein